MCVGDLKRVSEGPIYLFKKIYTDFGSDATSPLAVNSVERRCYDWTKSDSMFRMLIGTCGSDAVGPQSRFLRLHSFFLLFLTVTHF